MPCYSLTSDIKTFVCLIGLSYNPKAWSFASRGPLQLQSHPSTANSTACAAGVAFWEYDYLNGATDSDNLVRRTDSTFTNILQPAALAVVQKVAALPLVNGCVPGQIELPLNLPHRLSQACFAQSVHGAVCDMPCFLCGFDNDPMTDKTYGVGPVMAIQSISSGRSFTSKLCVWT